MEGERDAMSNRQVAALLRDVAMALKIKGADRFQAGSYDTAARGVAHAPAPVRELWRQGRLTDIPGVGGTIAGHLDEWFRTGRAVRFDEALSGIPDAVLELVQIPGVGPATAQKLVAAGVEDLDDLERRLERGDLTGSGLTAKALEKIAQGLAELTRRPDRVLLPSALAAVTPLLVHLRAAPSVLRAELAGSVRRRASTAANLNIAIATADIDAALAHARTFAGVERAEPLMVRAESDRDTHGARGLTMALHSGLPVQVLAVAPEQFGALWQWQTGSAAHNAGLARIAVAHGLRLSPGGLWSPEGPLATPGEEDVYRALGLSAPPPELREDRGELDGPLPRLLAAEDIRGDCHSHTTWSDGRDSARAMIEAAIALRRDYLVITDHSYPNLNYAQRAVEIELLQQAYPQIRLVNGLEVNITVEGGLQVPDQVLAAHQFCLASIHTGFRQPRDVITRRLLAALAHPAINGIAHPTGRLLLRREGIDADWDAVFEACLRYDKFLEIDGPADRLDLPDDLVREAMRRGVKLTVDSDAHATEELHNLTTGIDVARRGWAGPASVLNTLPYDQFRVAARVRG